MVNKHMPYDLKQMQSLPLAAKIIMTQQRIRQWYEHWEGQVYVSFSGGKDSTVLKHIVDSMYNDVPAVFVNTGLEYPEIQQFVRSIKAGKYDCFNNDIEIIRPEMRFDEVINKYGYPVFSKEVATYIQYGRKAIEKEDKAKERRYLYGERRNPKNGKVYQYMKLSKTALDVALNSNIPVSSMCCSIMKKKPAKKYAKETGRKSIQGTLAEESKLREMNWIKHGCNAFDSGEPISRPLSFWTEQDILQYLKKYDVPYCSVYGEIVPTSEEEQVAGQLTTFDILDDYSGTLLTTTGCDRTGCIFCMFGCHLEKEPNRFQRLKETHPRQYEYCIGGGEYVDGKWQPSKEGLGLGKVLDYIGVNYK